MQETSANVKTEVKQQKVRIKAGSLNATNAVFLPRLPSTNVSVNNSVVARKKFRLTFVDVWHQKQVNSGKNLQEASST